MAWGTGGVLGHRRTCQAVGLVFGAVLTAMTFPFTAATSAAVATSGTSASPDPRWRMTSLHETITVQNDGTIHVSERIVYDFGTAPGHGIVVYLDDTPLYTGGPAPAYTAVTVANADATAGYSLDSSSGQTAVVIGDPNRAVTGVQMYDLEYNVAHAVYADPAQPGTISLLWHAMVTSRADDPATRSVPVSDVEVIVQMPGAVTADQCWQGSSADPDSCTSTAARDAMVRFTQNSTTTGRQLTVRVTSAAGRATSLPSAAALKYPPTMPHQDTGNGMGLFLWAVIGASALLLIVIVGAVMIRRSRVVDHHEPA